MVKGLIADTYSRDKQTHTNPPSVHVTVGGSQKTWREPTQKQGQHAGHSERESNPPHPWIDVTWVVCAVDGWGTWVR